MAGALTATLSPVFWPIHRSLKTAKRFRVSSEIQNPPSISPPKDFKPPDPKPFIVRPSKYGDMFGASQSLLFRLGTGVFAQGYSVSFIPEKEFPPGEYAISVLGYKLRETARLGLQPEKPIEIYEFERADLLCFHLTWRTMDSSDTSAVHFVGRLERLLLCWTSMFCSILAQEMVQTSAPKPCRWVESSNSLIWAGPYICPTILLEVAGGSLF